MISWEMILEKGLQVIWICVLYWWYKMCGIFKIVINFTVCVDNTRLNVNHFNIYILKCKHLHFPVLFPLKCYFLCIQPISQTLSVDIYFINIILMCTIIFCLSVRAIKFSIAKPSTYLDIIFNLTLFIGFWVTEVSIKLVKF